MPDTRPDSCSQPVSVRVLVALSCVRRDGARSRAKMRQSKVEKKDVTITPTRAYGNVFGGEEIEFKFRVDSAKAIKGRVVWRLAAGHRDRQGRRGRAGRRAQRPRGCRDQVRAPPEIKDGVVLHTKLTLSVVRRRAGPSRSRPSNKTCGSSRKTRSRIAREWLKKLKINLYDPKGDTAKVFTAAKVPFEELQVGGRASAELKEGRGHRRRGRVVQGREGARGRAAEARGCGAGRPRSSRRPVAR